MGGEGRWAGLHGYLAPEFQPISLSEPHPAPGFRSSLACYFSTCGSSLPLEPLASASHVLSLPFLTVSDSVSLAILFLSMTILELSTLSLLWV